jgi:hypothetical protein
MPTQTYISLAEVTLGSTAASVTFSSISQSYRDLVFVLNGTLSVAEQDVMIILNGNSTNTDYFRIHGSGTINSTLSAGSGNFRNITNWGYWTNNENAMLVLQLMDYSATNKHKNFLVRSGRASSGLDMMSTRFASTSAINSVAFATSAGLFAAGTTLSLYGIEA